MAQSDKKGPAKSFISYISYQMLSVAKFSVLRMIHFKFLLLLRDLLLT